MTRTPEKISCEKLDTFDKYCWKIVLRLLISELSLKMPYDSNGSGNKVYNVSLEKHYTYKL
jgi:hypothetical protein